MAKFTPTSNFHAVENLKTKYFRWNEIGEGIQGTYLFTKSTKKNNKFLDQNTGLPRIERVYIIKVKGLAEPIKNVQKNSETHRDEEILINNGDYVTINAKPGTDKVMNSVRPGTSVAFIYDRDFNTGKPQPAKIIEVQLGGMDPEAEQELEAVKYASRGGDFAPSSDYEEEMDMSDITPNVTIEPETQPDPSVDINKLKITVLQEAKKKGIILDTDTKETILSKITAKFKIEPNTVDNLLTILELIDVLPAPTATNTPSIEASPF